MKGKYYVVVERVTLSDAVYHEISRPCETADEAAELMMRHPNTIFADIAYSWVGRDGSRRYDTMRDELFDAISRIDC